MRINNDENAAKKIAGQAQSLGAKLKGVGIATYRKDTYDRCLSIFDDAADLPATFDAWLAKLEQREHELRDEGVRIIRVEIDPDTFPAWCQDNGFSKVDRHARMAFATLGAIKVGEGG